MWWLPDFPATTSARKFSPREKELAVLRLQNDNQQVRNDEGPKMGHLTALKHALLAWKTWVFVVGYMVCFHESRRRYLKQND
jgi:hypothetical protein